MQVDPLLEKLPDRIDYAEFAHDIARPMAAHATALSFFSLPNAKAAEAVVVKDIIGAVPTAIARPRVLYGCRGPTWRI